MELIIDKIFSTTLCCIDDLLESQDINNMKKHIINSSKEIGKKENWQSSHDPKLHNHPKYKALTFKVLEYSKTYLDELLYEYDDFYITGMWSNILKSGEFHSPHNHSNNFLSGVYYVQAKNTAGIYFIDPRPQSGVLQPHAKTWIKDNSTTWSYPSITNRMIIFPSWLMHYVPINKTEHDRISISFNIMFKGEIGRPDYFQSNIFTENLK